MEPLHDHYPFGSLLPGRNYSAGSYRYLFQGQEHDDEINGSVGTSYAYEYRMHDPRIGRFLSIDPLVKKYPYWTPYAFSGNRVIDSRELEGLEPSGVNPNTGVETTANDTYSEHGQWDSQLIYPKSSPSPGAQRGFVEGLWALDRKLKGNEPENYDRERGEWGGFMYMAEGGGSGSPLMTTKPFWVTNEDGSSHSGTIIYGMSASAPGIPKGKDVDDVDDLFDLDGGTLFKEIGSGIGSTTDGFTSDAAQKAMAPVLERFTAADAKQQTLRMVVYINADSSTVVPHTVPNTAHNRQAANKDGFKWMKDFQGPFDAP